MSQVARCPSLVELREFLLGKAGAWDVETIEVHITECPVCQAHLGRIEAHDEIVGALRGDGRSSFIRNAEAGAIAEPPPGEATAESGSSLFAENLLPQLKRIPERLDQTVSRSTPDSTPADRASRSGTDTTRVGEVTGEARGVSPIAGRLGRYELTAVLGRGGMGTVFQAWDPLLERHVAVKVPRTELLTNRKVRERMLQEARAAAAVVDDHIVPIHSVEESDGTPYLVMPLLKGMTLKQAMEEWPQPVSVDELLRIGRESAAGLAAAHRHGLLHCDLKPGNLWLEDPAGRVKLLDFGLAVPVSDDGPEPVGGSGTPGYLAPEQVQHGPLDPRTDVFGLGCVLYQLATGRLPFTGPAAMRVYWTVMGATPPALSTVRPDLPERLGDLIARMLDRIPTGRPADGTAVLNELQRIERDRREIMASRTRRRTWLWTAGATLVSGGGMALWAAWFGPQIPADVIVRIQVADASVGAVLVRDGREWRVAPGGPHTLALAAGEYAVRPETPRSHWSVYPDRLVVRQGLANDAVTLSPFGGLANRAVHSLPGTGVLFRTDNSGSWVFSIGQDRLLVRWPVDKDSTSAAEVIELPHAGRCLALSADGTQIYTAGGNRQSPTVLELDRWDTRTLAATGRLEGAERITQAVDCSPDGRWVAAADGDGVRLWDSAGVPGPALTLEAATGVCSVRWNASGTRLAAVGESGRYAIWTCDRDQFRVTRQGVCGQGALRSAVWTEDVLLAAGDDKAVHQIAENALESVLVVNTASGIQSLALSDDGQWLLTGGASGTIGLWATADWRHCGEFSGHRGAVTSVAIEPGSRRAVSTGHDGTVRLWKLPILGKETVAKR